jgi:hypothetical protein
MTMLEEVLQHIQEHQAEQIANRTFRRRRARCLSTRGCTWKRSWPGRGTCYSRWNRASTSDALFLAKIQDCIFKIIYRRLR